MACEERDTDGAVDGVVDPRPAIGPAHDPHADKVGPQGRQGLVGQEALHREVGDKGPGVVPRRGREFLGQASPLRPGEVDGDGLLRLVQPLPVEAVAALAEGPAAEVRAAADIVEADHLGTQLGEVEAAGRPGHEGRALDHAQALQEVIHRKLLASEALASEALGQAQHVVAHMAEDEVGGDRGHLVEAGLPELALDVVLLGKAEATVDLDAGVCREPGGL